MAFAGANIDSRCVVHHSALALQPRRCSLFTSTYESLQASHYILSRQLDLMKVNIWSKRRISRNLRTSQEQQLDEGVLGVITRTFSRTSFSLRRCTRTQYYQARYEYKYNQTKRCLLSPLQNLSSPSKIIPQPTPRSVLPDYH